MGGNTGEYQKGSERDLYKYINHHAGTFTKKKRSRSNISSRDIRECLHVDTSCQGSMG